MEARAFLDRYGPWALIAGASEGTGAAFARQLAKKGFNLILIARREDKLAALAKEVAADHGIQCVIGAVDLAAEDATERMAALAGDREVGLLIFNAGSDWNGSMFLDEDIAAWHSLGMRNMMTVTHACHRFAGPMRARGRGGIILAGSSAGYNGMPGIVMYSATKAFNLVLGEGLWVELQPHGVDVLNLIMGQTDTPPHREHLARVGVDFPADWATADEVAALGLERLPHGPVVNVGYADDDSSVGGLSADARRERVLASGALALQYVKKG